MFLHVNVNLLATCTYNYTVLALLYKQSVLALYMDINKYKESQMQKCCVAENQQYHVMYTQDTLNDEALVESNSSRKVVTGTKKICPH